MLNVPNSEKYPLSNTSTNRQSSEPIPWIEWPNPRGKYQTSPALKSTVCDWPCGLIVVTRHWPLITSAHSAAFACQCSSRKPPGASDISTPASACETGNSATVASFAQPPSHDLGVTAPSRKRKDGSSAPASGAGVGPNGGCPCPSVSVPVAAATMPPAAAAPSMSRRENIRNLLDQAPRADRADRCHSFRSRVNQLGRRFAPAYPARLQRPDHWRP